MRNFDYKEDTMWDSQTIIENEGSLNYGPLSLCKIHRLVGDCYQTDLIHHKLNYSQLFSDFGAAFKKFQTLKDTLIDLGFKYKERYNV